MRGPSNHGPLDLARSRDGSRARWLLAPRRRRDAANKSEPGGTLMQFTRRRALALLAVPAVIAGRARAQTSALIWPQRPVRFIIPFGPGAGADIGARLIQEKLSARW